MIDQAAAGDQGHHHTYLGGIVSTIDHVIAGHDPAVQGSEHRPGSAPGSLFARPARTNTAPVMAGAEVAAGSAVVEHALLGTLLLSPGGLAQVETFLGPRDFASTDTRAVYESVRGLHAAGLLFDVAALPVEQRPVAAAENYQRVRSVLGTSGGRFTRTPVPRPEQVLAQLHTAAPPEGIELRGVFEPGMHVRLARAVLEDSCRRAVAAAGVTLRRPTKSVPLSTAQPTRRLRNTQTLVESLTRLHDRLDILATRLHRATRHTNPAWQPTRGEQPPDRTPAPAPERRERLGRNWPSWARPLRTRAERHLVHLALHCGRMREVPDEVLTLSPEHFVDPRSADLWRAISEVRQSGEPVNYVTVLRHVANLSPDEVAGRHLSQWSLRDLAAAPDTTPPRIARSLRVVTTAALADLTRQTEATLSAAIASTATTHEVLQRATAGVEALSGLATQSVRLQQAAHHHTQPGRHRA